ncbi:tyrosine-protein phosphatase non-receptor type substrate 1-like isoform X2 [Erpetoichthys calabaricus]|uniref:tyrosine-protein phosphatase non-receptor type substrate 1-like isoform X2 n=1 Tax=Erpetoichthys calabaricus TaxID=27687 RepID=UPI002233F9E2|nr:tyrosine-protein phosphatase non-receptor type substrate 1-like isoform X2 [Erpetoichthys calabaricus]
MQTPNIVQTSCLLSLLFHACQGFSISQPQGQVEVAVGSHVTLVCVVSSEIPHGPVTWYKETGSDHRHFFSSFPRKGDIHDRRVTRTNGDQTNNFSITIRDVRVSDTGKYYCEKYTKGEWDKPYALGPGVILTVSRSAIVQQRSPVKALEGSDVVLTCKMPSITSWDLVRWYKGEGSQRTHVYSGLLKAGDRNDARVTWSGQNPGIEFSIVIKGVKINDTGKYYCIKYDDEKGDTISKEGPGVTLIVTARNVTIIGPPGRVNVGEVVELQCEANNYNDGTFMWMKNGEAIPQDHFTIAGTGTRHTSRLTLQTEKGDIRSAVQCVQGKNEEQRMSEVFNLSSVITVMPRLQIQGSPDTRNSLLGKYSCRVDGFYPEDILVSWTLGRNKIPACCEKAQGDIDGAFSTTCHITIALAQISSGAVLQCHAGYHAHC